MKYTAKAILEGIRSKNNEILRFVYEKNYPPVKNFILVNNGSEQDARDIFQEAVIIIFRKVSKENIELKCNFNTYIFSICKNLWLMHVRGKKIETEIKKHIKNLNHNNFELDLETKENFRYRLYQVHFKKLDKDCQEILSMFFDGVSYEIIAEIMNYKNAEYAKRKKYLCKEELMRRIKSDPEFNEPEL